MRKDSIVLDKEHVEFLEMFILSIIEIDKKLSLSKKITSSEIDSIIRTKIISPSIVDFLRRSITIEEISDDLQKYLENKITSTIKSLEKEIIKFSRLDGNRRKQTIYNLNKVVIGNQSLMIPEVYC